ncbi:MAG: hypothetical protein AAGF95_13880 [Chloroflexota bacterium]
MSNKKLEDMTSEELLRLPPEEFTQLMQEAKRKRLADVQTISDPDYAGYTFEQKVRYWSSQINQQMRWQAESGLDPYAGFSRDWYEAVKRAEPHFDAIIDAAFEQFLSWEWDKAEYKRRIQQAI